jgi:DivIVA domain-containing protein
MLERPNFSEVHLREGYEIPEVDEFVERVWTALRQNPPAMGADDVASVVFRPVRLRAGYDMGEVDTWLDRAQAELASRGGVSSTTTVRQPPELHPAILPAAGLVLVIALVVILFLVL